MMNQFAPPSNNSLTVNTEDCFSSRGPSGMQLCSQRQPSRRHAHVDALAASMPFQP